MNLIIISNVIYINNSLPKSVVKYAKVCQILQKCAENTDCCLHFISYSFDRKKKEKKVWTSYVFAYETTVQT